MMTGVRKGEEEREELSAQGCTGMESSPQQNSSPAKELTKYDILKERMLIIVRDNHLLKDEILDLKDRLEKETAQRIEYEAAVKSLYKQIETLELNVESLEDRLKVTNRKYEEISHAAGIAERERKSLEQRSFHDEDRINELERKLAETTDIYSTTNKRVEELTQSLNKYKAYSEMYEKRATSAEEKLKVLERQLIDSNRSCMIAVSKYEKSAAEIEKYEREVSQSSKLLKLMEARTEVSESTVERLQIQIETLEKKLEEEEDLCRRLQLEMDTYVRDVNSL